MIFTCFCDSPMRILCPFLHILPNGIPTEAGNPLLDMRVVVPGEFGAINELEAVIPIYYILFTVGISPRKKQNIRIEGSYGENISS